MVAVIAVVVVMLVMSRGGGGASGGGSLLEIIPEDTTLLAIWDIQAILSAEDAWRILEDLKFDTGERQQMWTKTL